MKRIGILGGLGPESTAEYYTVITRRYYETHGDYAYPEIVIYSLSFREVIDAGYECAGKVKAAIEALHRAGADFVVAACNSIHIVYEEVATDVPIPWVSIMDVTAQKILEAGMAKVGLLGTVFTMSRGFYQRALTSHGIETVTPEADAQERINEIIFGELVRRQITEASRAFVLGEIDRLRERGAEGIVLGCTELPFLIEQAHTDAHVFDTTALHAERTLELALGQVALPPRPAAG